ncbi:MAG TPA: hypothetical protein VLL52_22905 [Anaerolineae bacterium]|nr:hypothetical protein [Anaerolineae bacterium]
MSEIYQAYIDMEIYGEAEKGQEFCHEIFLRQGNYAIELTAEDEDVDLDLYITDDEGEVLYKDESDDSGAAAWFDVYKTGVFRLYVKAYGDTEYTVALTEQDDDE